MAGKRVCVIGAGPSGTAVLRAFSSAQVKGAEIPEVVCYEKQEDWGGLWNYTWRTGIDKNGENVHGSMYRYLWSNGPKEALEFADYTFEEHFGKAIASYPPREVLCDYIKGRVEKAGVRKWVNFQHACRWVTFNEETKKFTVNVMDLVNDKLKTEEFDYCVCCSGHFSTPNVPHFDGIDRFGGTVVHAHDFRDADHYKGKNVMVVGASYSAEDIGSQCWKYGAKTITACYRTRPMGFHFPDNWDTKPLLTKIEGKQCHFKDGTSKEIDVIILCTGYKHHFPFLSDDIRLITDNRLWTKNLYQGICFEKNTQMFYIGMQDQFYTFNMFDAQAWLTRDMILGRFATPSSILEMKADSAPWETKEAAIETDEHMIRFQGAYVQNLIEKTDYPSFNIEAVNLTFLEWEHHKHEDIMGFRNNCYRSVMTGTMSPKHHTPWAEALDDSMEVYLKN